MFNSLPPRLKILKNDKTKFKATLTKHLKTRSFKSVDEFCM
jgi:hypothetical protein